MCQLSQPGKVIEEDMIHLILTLDSLNSKGNAQDVVLDVYVGSFFHSAIFVPEDLIARERPKKGLNFRILRINDLHLSTITHYRSYGQKLFENKCDFRFGGPVLA